MKALGALGGAASAVLRKDLVLTPTSVRLMDIQSALDHSKATRDLGSVPRRPRTRSVLRSAGSQSSRGRELSSVAAPTA